MVGVAATVVHAATYLVLVSLGFLAPMASNAAGFALGFAVSLAGQYVWTFGDRTRHLAGAARRTVLLRFTAVAALGFLLNTGFVALVEAIPGADPRLAVIFIVAVTPIAVFLLSNGWAFASGAGRAPTPEAGPRAAPAGAALRDWLVPALAIAAAVPFLANSLTWGLPQELDPDEMIFMGAALRMLASHSLDPGWYGAPAQPLIYALGAGYAVYIVILDQLGIIGSLGDAARFYFDDRSPFVVIGRAITALSTTACLVVMVAILREARAGLLAILFAIALFTLSPLVLGYASIIRMDFQQILFNLLTSWFCLRAITRGAEARNLLLAGACVGAAVTSKFTGIAGVAPVIATVAWLVADRRLHPVAGLALLLAAGAASLVAAFLTGPYLFLAWRDVLVAVANEARPTQLGQTSTGFASALSYYTTEGAPQALGLAPSLLAAAGMVLSLRRPIGIVTLPYAIVYLVFVSTLSLYWLRWFLPVVPFAAIFAAVAVDEATKRLGRGGGWRRLLVCPGALLALAPTALGAATVLRHRYLDLDTRIPALAWTKQNLPAGSRILIETDAPGISSRTYHALIVEPDRLVSWTDVEEHDRVTGYYTYFGMWAGSPTALVAAIRAEKVDYVMMSSWADRFQREASAYPKEVAIYAELRRVFPQVKEFLPPPGWAGPAIRVLSTTAP